MLTDQLVVSETFYSIQGEGKHLGTPALFLRLAGCNLTCKGFSYKDPKTGTHLGCDTATIWKSGKRYHFSELIQHWQKQGWLNALEKGCHVVITGGEPLIQQIALTHFFEHLHPKVFIEIETNATFLALPKILQRANLITSSPKLAFAGDSRLKRYNPAAIKQHASNPNSIFKFVIHVPSDVDEVFEEYIQPFSIPTEKVWLMPEGGTREANQAIAPWLVELCKTHCINYSPREHITIWNEATGV